MSLPARRIVLIWFLFLRSNLDGNHCGASRIHHIGIIVGEWYVFSLLRCFHNDLFRRCGLKNVSLRSNNVRSCSWYLMSSWIDMWSISTSSSFSSVLDRKFAVTLSPPLIYWSWSLNWAMYCWFRHFYHSKQWLDVSSYGEFFIFQIVHEMVYGKDYCEKLSVESKIFLFHRC